MKKLLLPLILFSSLVLAGPIGHPVFIGAPSGWIFVESKTASDSATVEFNNLASGFDYEVTFDAIVPATNNVKFRLKTDSDNGASFDEGATDYSYGMRRIGAGSVSNGNGSTGDTSIRMDRSSVGSATNELYNGFLLILNPSNTVFTQVFGRYHMTGHVAALTEVGYFSGVRHSAALVNAIQFLMESGNIASGTITLRKRVR